MKARYHKFGALAWLSAIATIGILSSCDPHRVFEENREIKGGTWNVLDTISFQVEIRDSIHPKNIYINIRNSGTYAYSNLFMFVTIKFPNGKMSKDTVECILADQKHWLGRGLGGLWDHQILYRNQVRFPLLGRYTITYEQAQRSGAKAFIEDLPGIEDVGVRIEKHQ
jgi:gliding motility-associated lipoprotein GldH